MNNQIFLIEGFRRPYERQETLCKLFLKYSVFKINVYMLDKPTKVEDLMQELREEVGYLKIQSILSIHITCLQAASHAW